MIGSAVATNLARNGLKPNVFDIRDGASDSLDGVQPQLGSPREVARNSDVVMIAVVNAEQAEDVLVGDDGLLTDDCDGLAVVLLSTVSLKSVHHLAWLCQQRDAVLLDAGVTSGGGQASEDGLVVMVGGADHDVALALPVLRGFARSVIHCGALGTGMAAKLARNTAQYGRWAVMAEAAALAAAGGVPQDRFLQVMEDGADGRDESLTWLRAHRTGVKLSEHEAAPFEELARKDLCAAQKLAGQLGVEVGMTNLAAPRMGAVISGDTSDRLPHGSFDRGVTMMEKVMGSSVSALMPRESDLPIVTSTVEHLFADIWSRPHLTIRDRRLLVLGATAMLGRTDLLKNHLSGALRAGELTTDQLREISLFMHYYAGWGNGTAINTVVERMIAGGDNDDEPPAVPSEDD
jgi:3-hydroxyisobutyrate dehydrogenase-like beta-hydroxyacid dehydrogenase